MAHGDAALGEIVHAERIAEGVGQFFELEHFFRVGLFVDAVQRGDAAFFEILRDGFVRGEHEFFDEAMGDVALAADDAACGLLVEFDDRLGQIEIDGAAFAAALFRSSASSFMRRNASDQRRVALGHFRIAFEHFVDVGVGHALGGANHAGREVRADHFSGRVHFHDALMTRRSTFGLSEQMPLESSSGSMGTARFGK